MQMSSGVAYAIVEVIRSSALELTHHHQQHQRIDKLKRSIASYIKYMPPNGNVIISIRQHHREREQAVKCGPKCVSCWQSRRKFALVHPDEMQ